MIIGGIQKTSLIDYPSKICCVVFTSGCNFRCPYCHNPDLVNTDTIRSAYDAKGIFSFLEERKSFLDGVVVSGGEPTLQKDLFDFCSQIKKLGYPVKLDTNGSKPDIIKKLLNAHLIDYIAMDIKTDPARYTPIITKFIDPTAIQSSIRLILESGIASEFRTTCVKSIVDKEDIRTIARLIQGAKLFALNKVQYHHLNILNPEFFENSDWYCNDQTIEEFREIASDFVQYCIVR
jgi:pyruvate formate lyase activating enzyme